MGEFDVKNALFVRNLIATVAEVQYKSVLRQVNHPILPIFSDEGVCRIVTDVVMSYPDTFKAIYPMMPGYVSIL